MKQPYESTMKGLENRTITYVDGKRTETPIKDGLTIRRSFVDRWGRTGLSRIALGGIAASLLSCAVLLVGVRAFSKNELTGAASEPSPVEPLIAATGIEPQQGVNVSVFVTPSLRVGILRAAGNSGRGGGVITWTTVKPGGQALKSIDVLVLEYDSGGVLTSCEGRRVPISLAPGHQQDTYYFSQTHHKPENHLILTVSALRDASGVQELALDELINAVGVFRSGGVPAQLRIREKVEDAVPFDPAVCPRASSLAHSLAQRSGRPVMGFLCDRYRNGFSFFYGQSAAK